MERKNITLNNGYNMPRLGLGTWQLNGKMAERTIYNAIKVGYRLIDTALIYENEENVGIAVRKAIEDGIVTRKELFITTKLLASGFSDYKKAIDDCNNRLGLQYIDLMLIHQQGKSEQELCKSIECKIDEGIIKSFGISNYYTKEDFNRIIKYSAIYPTVIQNENHIFFNNSDLKKYVSKYGTIIQSYYPFGGRGHISENFNNETIRKLAEKYGKTPSQIILRWQLQSGYVFVFGCSKEEHLIDNMNIFDFNLDNEDMEKINKLNSSVRYENW